MSSVVAVRPFLYCFPGAFYARFAINCALAPPNEFRPRPDGLRAPFASAMMALCHVLYNSREERGVAFGRACWFASSAISRLILWWSSLSHFFLCLLWNLCCCLLDHFLLFLLSSCVDSSFGSSSGDFPRLFVCILAALPCSLPL